MTIEKTSQDEFKDTPQDNARRWTMELRAAREKLSGWHKEAEEADDAMLMRKRDTDGTLTRRLAFFQSNVATQLATMYGRAPQATSERRFADASDDVARIAAEMQQRLLNADLERDSDSSYEAFGNGLADSLETDFACQRVRYVAEFETTPETPEIPPRPDGTGGAPAVPAVRRKVFEDAEVNYVHWRDMLWSPARVWADVRWVSFLSPMSKRAFVDKFGEDAWRTIQLNSKRAPKDADAQKAHPWARVDVHEIWEKEGRRVWWFVEGSDSVLIPQGVEVDEGGAQPDPYELENFWPCTKPVILNASTSALVPKPDYALTRDVYNSLDTLATRCSLLVDALKVAGVYDKTLGVDVQRILEAGENKLVPCDNWALFAEKGGIRGAIDWFPVEQVANTLNSLRDVMREQQDLLYQLTGRSDLERGQATQAGATATEQRAKVRYGSVRMQRRQGEFARMVSETLRLKAQLIAKWFDPQTILERSNAQFMPEADRPKAMEAVQLLKSRASQFRVEVKPETLALQDFAALKEERTEVILAVSQYLTAIAPMAAQMPASAPFLLKILQWMVSGLRGAKQIEGVLDQAIQMAEQAAAQPQQPPQDTKLLAQQLKGQQDLQKVQAELQADLVRTQAEVQADATREQNQAVWNVREQQQKALIARAMKPPEPPGGIPGA